MLLVVAMASVLLGTLYPLFLDALGLGKISVGPPYFNAVFVPLLAPALFLMGIGPLARWRHASLPDLWSRLRWAFGGRDRRGGPAAVYARTLVATDRRRFVPRALDCGERFVNLYGRLASSQRGGLMAKLAANSPSYYGMLLAHLGVAVFVAGVTLVKGYEIEQDVRLDVGQAAAVGGYQFRFLGVHPGPGPNYRALVGTIDVLRNGRLLESLHPEKRNFNASGDTMTIAAIDVGLLGDRYVSLGEPLERRPRWPMERAHLPQAVHRLDLGGRLLMALGGLVAICDRRYRLAAREKSAAVPAASGSAVAAD